MQQYYDLNHLPPSLLKWMDTSYNDFVQKNYLAYRAPQIPLLHDYDEHKYLFNEFPNYRTQLHQFEFIHYKYSKLNSCCSIKLSNTLLSSHNIYSFHNNTNMNDTMNDNMNINHPLFYLVSHCTPSTKVYHIPGTVCKLVHLVAQTNELHHHPVCYPDIIIPKTIGELKFCQPNYLTGIPTTNNPIHTIIQSNYSKQILTPQLTTKRTYYVIQSNKLCPIHICYKHIITEPSAKLLTSYPIIQNIPKPSIKYHLSYLIHLAIRQEYTGTDMPLKIDEFIITNALCKVFVYLGINKSKSLRYIIKDWILFDRELDTYVFNPNYVFHEINPEYLSIIINAISYIQPYNWYEVNNIFDKQWKRVIMCLYIRSNRQMELKQLLHYYSNGNKQIGHQYSIYLNQLITQNQRILDLLLKLHEYYLYIPDNQLILYYAIFMKKHFTFHPQIYLEKYRIEPHFPHLYEMIHYFDTLEKYQSYQTNILLFPNQMYYEPTLLNYNNNIIYNNNSDDDDINDDNNSLCSDISDILETDDPNQLNGNPIMNKVKLYGHSIHCQMISKPQKYTTIEELNDSVDFISLQSVIIQPNKKQRLSFDKIKEMKEIKENNSHLNEYILKKKYNILGECYYYFSSSSCSSL